jgi:hypothetical protein
VAFSRAKPAAIRAAERQEKTMSGIELVPGPDLRTLAKDARGLLRRAGRAGLAVAALGLVAIVPIALRAWLAFGHVH